MIPERTKQTIDDYVNNKLQPGHFVTAVLANDLKEAIGRADCGNQLALASIVQYVVCHTPYSCHGSYEIVERWLKNESE